MTQKRRTRKIGNDELEALADLSERTESERFQVSFIDTYIGNGVFAKQKIRAGDLLLEYRGKLLHGAPEQDTAYVYYFTHGCNSCIDATDNSCMARMVNDIDSATKANCKMKLVVVRGDPHLALYALKDIEKGAELRYDYGDRKAPWRKRKRKGETERPVLYTKPSCALGGAEPEYKIKKRKTDALQSQEVSKRELTKRSGCALGGAEPEYKIKKRKTDALQSQEVSKRELTKRSGCALGGAEPEYKIKKRKTDALQSQVVSKRELTKRSEPSVNGNFMQHDSSSGEESFDDSADDPDYRSDTSDDVSVSVNRSYNTEGDENEKHDQGSSMSLELGQEVKSGVSVNISNNVEGDENDKHDQGSSQSLELGQEMKSGVSVNRSNNTGDKNNKHDQGSSLSLELGQEVKSGASVNISNNVEGDENDKHDEGSSQSLELGQEVKSGVSVNRSNNAEGEENDKHDQGSNQSLELGQEMKSGVSVNRSNNTGDKNDKHDKASSQSLELGQEMKNSVSVNRSNNTEVDENDKHDQGSSQSLEQEMKNGVSVNRSNNSEGDKNDKHDEGSSLSLELVQEVKNDVSVNRSNNTGDKNDKHDQGSSLSLELGQEVKSRVSVNRSNNTEVDENDKHDQGSSQSLEQEMKSGVSVNRSNNTEGDKNDKHDEGSSLSLELVQEVKNDVSVNRSNNTGDKNDKHDQGSSLSLELGQEVKSGVSVNISNNVGDENDKHDQGSSLSLELGQEVKSGVSVNISNNVEGDENDKHEEGSSLSLELGQEVKIGVSVNRSNNAGGENDKHDQGSNQSLELGQEMKSGVSVNRSNNTGDKNNKPDQRSNQSLELGQEMKSGVSVNRSNNTEVDKNDKHDQGSSQSLEQEMKSGVSVNRSNNTEGDKNDKHDEGSSLSLELVQEVKNDVSVNRSNNTEGDENEKHDQGSSQSLEHDSSFGEECFDDSADDPDYRFDTSDDQYTSEEDVSCISDSEVSDIVEHYPALAMERNFRMKNIGVKCKEENDNHDQGSCLSQGQRYKVKSSVSVNRSNNIEGDKNDKHDQGSSLSLELGQEMKSGVSVNRSNNTEGEENDKHDQGCSLSLELGQEMKSGVSVNRSNNTEVDENDKHDQGSSLSLELGQEMKSGVIVCRSNNTEVDENDKHDQGSSLLQEHGHKVKSSLSVYRSNNTEGKRKWDKSHFCLFCGTSSTNITKHYFTYLHKSEPEVQKILNLPLKSHKRKVQLLQLRNAGDFKHNTDILKKGTGVLVTSTRQQQARAAEDYLPCENCLGFFQKHSLWRHRQICPLRKTGQKKRKIQSEAALLLPASTAINTGLKEKVISRMAGDGVTIAARADSTIVKIGEKLYQKHCNKPHLYTHISQKMRELGRFLISARLLDTDITKLSDVINPEKFPVAITATRTLCKYNEVTNTYGNPSLAMKLSHLLKKSAKVLKSVALMHGDTDQGNRADAFLTLCDDEWTEEISSAALQTLVYNKMNKGHMLPLSEDIMKLQSYFQSTAQSLAAELKNSFSRQDWECLNQLTLAQVVMFNRRRGGETQRLTVSTYMTRKKSSEPAPKEVQDSLSKTEKMLLSTLSRLEITGKKGRTVPVLLTPSVQKNIDLLLKWRNEAGVSEENEYLFPRPNFGSVEPLRSSDVPRRFANEAQLQCPENITSTRLRKHVATVTQVLNLDSHDLEVMTSFMGHDMIVHRSFYRLPQETLQVARMGRLLMAFNNGTVGQYSGKSIDEISLDDDNVSSEDEDDDEGESDEEHTGCCVSPKGNQICSSAAAASGFNPSETNNSQGKTAKPVKEKTRREAQRLTEDQTNLLKTLFKSNVLLRRELRRIDCDKVLDKYPVLVNLDWKKVKNTIHNWITREKRKMKQFKVVG